MMRQRDPRERQLLAQVRRGDPSGYAGGFLARCPEQLRRGAVGCTRPICSSALTRCDGSTSFQMGA
jgi:hypothetical protein